MNDPPPLEARGSSAARSARSQALHDFSLTDRARASAWR